MKHNILYIFTLVTFYIFSSVVFASPFSSSELLGQKASGNDILSVKTILTAGKYKFRIVEKEYESYLAVIDENSRLYKVIGSETEVKTTTGESFISFGVDIVNASEKNSYILLLTDNGAAGMYNRVYLLLIDTKSFTITKVAEGCSAVKLEDKVIIYDYVEVIYPELYIAQKGFTCYSYSGKKLPNTFVTPCSETYSFEYDGNKYLLHCNIYADGSADGKLLAPSLDIDNDVYGGMTHTGTLLISTDVDDDSFMVKITKNNNTIQGVVDYSYKETPVSIKKIK